MTGKVYFDVESHQVVICLLFGCYMSKTGLTELEETYPEYAASH